MIRPSEHRRTSVSRRGVVNRMLAVMALVLWFAAIDLLIGLVAYVIPRRSPYQVGALGEYEHVYLNRDCLVLSDVLNDNSIIERVRQPRCEKSDMASQRRQSS